MLAHASTATPPSAPMGVLEKLKSAAKASLVPADDWQPGVKAAIGGTQLGSSLSEILPYLDPTLFPGGIYSRSHALTVPTVDRARDVLCSTVGVLPLRYWKTTAVTEDDEQLEPLTWMDRPDPNRTRSHIMAWTVDDLIFHARAFWQITSRYSTKFPQTFRRMPFSECAVTKSKVDPTVDIIRWNDTEIRPDDVVDFQGLTEGLLCVGARAICIALKLDQAAERFADVELPAGILKETDSGNEPMDQDELDELADHFSERRKSHVTAALSAGLTYEVPPWDAEKMQLTEARQHAALELSRLMSVPPWMVGAPTGSSMTYQNGSQARLDLIDFGSLPYLTTIEQTLSGPNVTPRGSYVKFDTDAWLRNPLLTVTPAAPDTPQKPTPA